jgi:uncharacterized paraquat-inducible protein A
MQEPERGKLKCNNKKCGHVFAVQDFHSNRSYSCQRCNESSYYRTTDYIRATYPKELEPSRQ